MRARRDDTASCGQDERNFTEGQQVKTGDLLFRIEPDIYKATVDQQNANLAKAKATEVNANLQLQRGQELLHNQNIPQSTDVLQAQALLEQAKINLGYTEIRSPIFGRALPSNAAAQNVIKFKTPMRRTRSSLAPFSPFAVVSSAARNRRNSETSGRASDVPTNDCGHRRTCRLGRRRLGTGSEGRRRAALHRRRRRIRPANGPRPGALSQA
jgi:hypothetical protein